MVQENLIQDMVEGGTCAPITDYWAYANRIWNTSDPMTYILIMIDMCHVVSQFIVTAKNTSLLTSLK